MSRKFFQGKHWFFEETEKLGIPASPAWGVLPEREIYSGRSAYQEIEIFEAEGYGCILALDGVVQLSTQHGCVYHEMLVHPAAFYHDDPRRVFIIGGGDGGALREITKHPVEEILLVDIDEAVIEVSKTHLLSVSMGAFDDPRVTLITEDAVDVIRRYQRRFDLIISDSTDAYGPSKALWADSFYRLVGEALDDDGIACFQTGYFTDAFARKERKRIKERFLFSTVHRAHVGCFPFDEYTFTVVSKKIDFSRITVEHIQEKFRASGITTQYYSPEIHFASAVIPKYFGEPQAFCR
ncbi:MAG: spermidine synthase [Pseudomonadota bacterium]